MKICETDGCYANPMPGRDRCARCIYDAMAAKAAAAAPPPGSRAMADGDLGEDMREAT